MITLLDAWQHGIAASVKNRIMPMAAARWLISFRAPAIRCCGEEVPEILEVGARDFRVQCSRCKKTWRVVDV